MRVFAYPMIVDRKIFEINEILKKLLAADRTNLDDTQSREEAAAVARRRFSH